MIELNLLEKKEPIKLPLVLGMDLNSLNFKMLGIALAILYIPEIFVHHYYEGQLKEKEETVSALLKELEKLEKDNGKNVNIKQQLDAFNKQVEKLKARSAQVDEILKLRTNPKKILEKIARSIPDDVWIDSLKITEAKDIFINGGSYSSRPVGEFITIMNDSPFLGNSLTPVKQENKQDNLDGTVINFELFELKGKIKNFEMRSN